MTNTATLTFEIGTEEIPSAPLYGALAQMEKNARAALKETRLEFGELHVHGTPRRIILVVEDLAEATEARVQRVKGPSAAIAYAEDGTPSKALEGFVRSKGATLDDIERVEEGGAEYVYAVIEQKAEAAVDILPELLCELVSSLDWKKSQRWGSGEERFVRPIRWLFALYGNQIIPTSFGELEAACYSYGHRLRDPLEMKIENADALLPVLKDACVMVDVSQRRETIEARIREIEAELKLKAIVPEGVLKEVVNLVEYPVVEDAVFDEAFLNVPREIISDAMLSHQRYFPLEDANGKLTNHFIVVHNGDPKRSKQIIEGHERVIRARLSDAAFFYQEDLKRTPEEYVGDLQNVVFQEKLGTVLDKVNRMMGLTGELAELANLSQEETLECLRATLLAKADLVTSAVDEFPSLQGIMGGYYAKAAGESDAVATAIPEHYRPRFSGDAIPSNQPGVLTALSDKLDTIAGLFAIGQKPTGSSDPFALRRAAIGVLAILIEHPLFRLNDAIELAVGEYSGRVELDRDTTIEELGTFFAGRLKEILKERGYEHDTVDAVLATGVLDPKDAIERCEALQNARNKDKETFENLATAFTRASKIGDPSLGHNVDESLLELAEVTLLNAIKDAEGKIDTALGEKAYSDALTVLGSLRSPVDTFFDEILVMDEDMKLRENRLRLLNRFTALFADIADFRKLSGVK